MAELTLELLNGAWRAGWRRRDRLTHLPGADCQMSVRKLNERQYVANMPNVRARGREAQLRHVLSSLRRFAQVENLEVWFQRASDVVRKMRTGDLDLGIVGYDMFVELGEVRSGALRSRVALTEGAAPPSLAPGRRRPGCGP